MTQKTKEKERWSIASRSSTNNEGQTEPFLQRKRRDRSGRLVPFNTSKGTLQIRIPRRQTKMEAADAVEQASLCFGSNTSESFTLLHVCFTRVKHRSQAPTIYGQLSIILPMSEDEEKAFDNDCIGLIENGTVEEIDRAIRSGRISPYRICKGGINLLFYVSLSRQTHRCVWP
jgi:hypothetical protein